MDTGQEIEQGKQRRRVSRLSVWSLLLSGAGVLLFFLVILAIWAIPDWLPVDLPLWFSLSSAVLGVTGIVLGIVSFILVQVKRRSLKGRWHSVAAVVIYAPFVLPVVTGIVIIAFISDGAAEFEVKRQRLLYQTDHQELLEACREVIKRYNEGLYSDPLIYRSDDALEEGRENIPEAILDIEPVRIWCDEDSVTVAIRIWMSGAGVRACSVCEEAEPRWDEVKLIDGLYFFDDELVGVGEDYKAYLVETLKDESLTYDEWLKRNE
jgi:hypothetical protein